MGCEIRNLIIGIFGYKSGDFLKYKNHQRIRAFLDTFFNLPNPKHVRSVSTNLSINYHLKWRKL